MYLSILNHNPRILEFLELNFEHLFWNQFPIKLNSQYSGYEHMVDFKSRFLDTQ